MFIDKIGAWYLSDFQDGSSVKASLHFLYNYTLSSRRK